VEAIFLPSGNRETRLDRLDLADDLPQALLVALVADGHEEARAIDGAAPALLDTGGSQEHLRGRARPLSSSP